MAKGWRAIGYHRVIEHSLHPRYEQYGDKLEPGHLIKIGRHVDDDYYLTEEEKGAHAYGFNHNSLGVVVCCGPELPPTEIMMDALDLTLNIFWERYNLPVKTSTIKGHREGYPTECPGDEIMAHIKDFREKYVRAA